MNEKEIRRKVRENLDAYRSEAEHIILGEKIYHPEEENFCLVNQNYGFLYRISGNRLYGEIREEFQGSRELYGKLGGDNIGEENWYMDWLDSVFKVEDEEFVLLTDQEVGEYLEDISEKVGEVEDYVERTVDDVRFLHREIEF